MSISTRQRKQLKSFIDELSKHRGRHTELVSVYVPAGYDLNKITAHLAQEQGTATNIKSTSTRKNVIDALEKMIQHLKLYPKTPANGLVAFSGNVAEREGQSDVQAWSIEPPVPLNIRIYRCDKEFVLEHLQDMCETKEVYGLVVMDRREATIALLRGKTIVPLTKATSNVPGKTRAGGQSAHRFERLREGAALDFYKKISEYMKKEFLDLEGLQGIILGGPGPTKHQFLETGDLTNEVKKKVIGVLDVTYTDEFGLQELLEKAQDILANEEVAGEKKLMGQFFELLSTKPGMVSYGKAQIEQDLQIGSVDKLLLSEIIDDKEIERLEKEAEKVGTEVVIISVETREGVQLKEIGGYGAILRFEKKF